jgi:archaemetzincin
MNKLVILLIALSFLCYSCEKKKERLSIGIQPFGSVEEEDIEVLYNTISLVFDATVHVLPSVSLPESAFIHEKSPRYRGDSLVLHLIRIKPDTINYIIGITTKDISVTKYDHDGTIKSPQSKYSDWGVFGLAQLRGSSCLVSTFRLNPKHPHFHNRLSKITIHELGHNFGLPHCPNDSCIMQDAAESIHTIDGVELYLCSKCHQRVVGKINPNFSSNK